MGKSQATIVQFVLFFVIGFFVFTAVANFFWLRIEGFKEEGSENMRKLISSYVSSIVISSYCCKECDVVKTSFTLENTSFGYYYFLNLSQKGINVSTQPGGKYYLSSVLNLNATLNFSGNASSARTINLTFTKNQNKIEVS